MHAPTASTLRPLSLTAERLLGTIPRQARIALCGTFDEAEKLWTVRRTYMLQRGYLLLRRQRAQMHLPYHQGPSLTTAAILSKAKRQQSWGIVSLRVLCSPSRLSWLPLKSNTLNT
jgi:hypothetical protein